jgi:hypothetical protein
MMAMTTNNSIKVKPTFRGANAEANRTREACFEARLAIGGSVYFFFKKGSRGFNPRLPDLWMRGDGSV